MPSHKIAVSVINLPVSVFVVIPSCDGMVDECYSESYLFPGECAE